MTYAIRILLLFSIAAFWGSCKDDDVDDCVKGIVGEWNCQVSATCSFSMTLVIEPSTGCEIFITNLPYDCNPSTFMVRGTVSGSTFSIPSQPFGAGTIEGSGSVYLNQITFTATLSSGQTYQAVGSR